MSHDPISACPICGEPLPYVEVRSIYARRRCGCGRPIGYAPADCARIDDWGVLPGHVIEHRTTRARWTPRTGQMEIPLGGGRLRRGEAHSLGEATAVAISGVIAADAEDDRRADIERRNREAITARSGVSVIDRARRYLHKMDPSIAGAGGAAALMRAARVLVAPDRFALPHDVALDLLVEYDARSVPPWGRGELARALRSAMRRAGGRAA